MGAISKPALCRAYLFKRVGEGSRRSRLATDRLNNSIFCTFLYSWVCVLQSRHTSVCQFLKDMILKWNYSANKSFLLLLKFIWVISGKGKARRVHSTVSLINILGRGTIYQRCIVPQSPSLNYGGGGGQRKKGEYNCTKLHGFHICALAALEEKTQHR